MVKPFCFNPQTDAKRDPILYTARSTGMNYINMRKVFLHLVFKVYRHQRLKVLLEEKQNN